MSLSRRTSAVSKGNVLVVRGDRAEARAQRDKQECVSESAIERLTKRAHNQSQLRLVLKLQVRHWRNSMLRKKPRPNTLARAHWPTVLASKPDTSNTPSFSVWLCWNTATTILPRACRIRNARRKAGMQSNTSLHLAAQIRVSSCVEDVETPILYHTLQGVETPCYMFGNWATKWLGAADEPLGKTLWMNIPLDVD